MDANGVWIGRWAADQAGITVRTTHSSTGDRLEDLIGVGLRRNPKRVQLLVSTVLGKHVPADPRLVADAGARLGGLVAEVLAGAEPLVVGFAETATLLGHLVADELRAPYIHSTRRFDSGVATWSTFTEAHSHATGHALQPWPPDQMTKGEAVVLVDDEISTARTALSTIAALHALAPRARYVIAALVDLATADDRERVAVVAAELGVSIECISLVRGEITVPDGVVVPPDTVAAAKAATAEVRRLRVTWPASVREGARHGFDADHGDLDDAIRDAAALVAAELPRRSGRTRVLGTEELMYTPFRIARELPGEVRFSTTTRSPAVVLDQPGYPLRHGIEFAAHEVGASGTRYAYNLKPGDQDQIVLVLDEGYDTGEVGELVHQLARHAPFVLVVTVPTFRPEA